MTNRSSCSTRRFSAGLSWWMSSQSSKRSSQGDLVRKESNQFAGGKEDTQEEPRSPPGGARNWADFVEVKRCGLGLATLGGGGRIV